MGVIKQPSYHSWHHSYQRHHFSSFHQYPQDAVAQEVIHVPLIEISAQKKVRTAVTLHTVPRGRSHVLSLQIHRLSRSMTNRKFTGPGP